ncbi:MAG: TonB-dependent receptor [Mucinivorans sp.]
MKKLLLFFVVLLAGLQIASAQSMSVSGKVTYADDGTPVIGAQVMVKGMRGVGTLTDVNGAYKITIPAAAPEKVIVASFLGLKSQERAISSNGQVVNFALATSTEKIEAVVVTAYGTTTKRAFTGSAAVVDAKEIKNMQLTSPTQALQGLATGVMSVSALGQPGENPAIRIRGIGSFVEGGGAPLIVVDGVTFNGNLNSINPNDMASMTVLKDANSTALYGSRAANGVIVITTKSGRSGKAVISAQARYGMSSRAVREFDFVGGEEYMKMTWQSLYNDAFYVAAATKGNALASGQKASSDLLGRVIYNPYGSKYPEPVDSKGNIVAGAKLLYDQDWQDALMQTGQRQQYDFQVAGGTNAVTYLVSAGLLDESAILRNSNFTRYNARVKVDARPTKWLEIGMNAAVSYSKQNNPSQQSTIGNSAVYFARAVANIYPAYMTDENGVYVRDDKGNMMPDFGGAGTPHTGVQGQTRPVLPDTSPLGTSFYDKQGRNRFLSTTVAYAQASFLNGFKLRTQAGVEYSHDDRMVYWNPIFGQGSSTQGNSEKMRYMETTVTWTNTLTYDRTFNGKHHVSGLLGLESDDYNYSYLYASRSGYDFGGVDELDYGSVVKSASSNSTMARNMRYIFRAAYDFDDRLHFSGSLSYDGSSRFVAKNRWGLFYSLGAAWNISNENFWKDAGVHNWFNDFKLRASYGSSGNQNVGSLFPYKSTYSAGWNMPGYGGSTIGRLGNSDLQWEKQNQFDVGLDFGFLNNAITFSAGFYDRTSVDLLMSRPLPLSSGIVSIYDNIGQVRNTGFEFEINAVPINRSNVRWSIGFNISTQKNKVLALPESAMLTGGMSNPGSESKWLKVGESSYSWYMREWAGVDPKDGAPMWWKDLTDKDGNVTGRETTKSFSEGTRKIVADALPKVLGGINTTLELYGVQLSVICSYALGHKIYNDDKAQIMHSFTTSDGGHQTITENRGAWKNPGDITDIPRFGGAGNNFGAMSTRWLVPGDYLRVRNITLGYDFTYIKGLKVAGVNELRFYCTAENPFTIFGERGIDPEQGLSGMSNNYSSMMKTISFGISIGF